MATFQRLPSGNWRAIIRRKGQYVSGTFLERKAAEMWARRVEREIDIGRNLPRELFESVVRRCMAVLDEEDRKPGAIYRDGHVWCGDAVGGRDAVIAA